MSNDVAIRFLLLQLLKLEVLYVIESCCKTSNFNNGLFIEGRKRTNGMLLERFTFLINPLIRQIVALVVCVTIIDKKLVQFLHNSFKYCHLWTIVYVVQRGYRPFERHKKTRY